MINASEAREDDAEFQSPVDLMFERLEEKDPEHFAVKQYTKADDVYGGRLPVHVRCLLDEVANITIPNLERLISVFRSREISACLVVQAQSQLKAIYKENADTIIGNCVRPEVASAL